MVSQVKGKNFQEHCNFEIEVKNIIMDNGYNIQEGQKGPDNFELVRLRVTQLCEGSK